MPSAKRNKAKPPADSLEVNDDGTIDIRVKGEMVYLRCPTVGELEKLVVGHAGLVKELSGIATDLAASQQSLLDLATRVSEGEEPPEALGAVDESEALDLLARQRRIVADFWADEIIGPLSDGDCKIEASDLPAFLSHGGSIGRALRGWYGLPSVPGDG